MRTLLLTLSDSGLRVASATGALATRQKSASARTTLCLEHERILDRSQHRNDAFASKVLSGTPRCAGL